MLVTGLALLLTAVLLALSFPLPGWGWLAWVALAPAAWAARRAERPWGFAGLAAVLFALWWGWMLRWLWPVTGTGVIGLALFQASFWVLALVLVRYVTRPIGRFRGVPMVVALPVLWVGLEWVRGSWPLGGFGWFALAHTQGVFQDGGPWASAQLAEWVGQHGIALVMLVGTALVVDAVSARSGVPRVVHAVLFVALLVVVKGHGDLMSGRLMQRLFSEHDDMLLRSDEPVPPRPFVVALVQTNAPHSNKLAPTAVTMDADWAELKALHERAVGGGVAEAARAGEGERVFAPDLIVWPESVVPGEFNEDAALLVRSYAGRLAVKHPDAWYWQRVGRYPFEARAWIAEGGVPTVVGAGATDGLGEEEPREFNSAFLVAGDGTMVGRYDKVHLVPWGEYVPGPAWLKAMVLNAFSPYPEDYSIDRGTELTVLEVPAALPGSTRAAASQPRAWDGEPDPPPVRIVMPICFEDTVGRLCRRMVYHDDGTKRADLIVNLTTNGWFGHLPSDTHPTGGLGWRSMRYQHLQIASLRAIENRVPVVRAVNTGVSAVIQPDGTISALGEPGEAVVVSSWVTLDGRTTLYAIVGEWPMVAVAFTGLGLVGYTFWRRRQRDDGHDEAGGDGGAGRGGADGDVGGRGSGPRPRAPASGGSGGDGGGAGPGAA